MLRVHIASVHEGKKAFNCEICDYGCSLRNLLNKHIASAHENIAQEGFKPFKCGKCDYSCSILDDLNRHYTSAHEGNKSFKCESCNVIF